MSVLKSPEIKWRLDEAHVRPPDTILCPAIHEASLVARTDQATLRHDPWLRQRDIHTDERAPLPSPVLPNSARNTCYPHLQSERVVAVGAGAASLLLVAYLTARGLRADNATFIDPSGEFGGMWNKDWAQAGGINNPAPLQFLDRTMKLHNRRATQMLNFLQGVAQTYLGTSAMLKDTVVDLRNDKPGRPWRVITESGATQEAEYVLLCPGTPEPTPITGERLESNLDYVHRRTQPEYLTVERYQRSLTEEELSSGRHIVLMGLGNSTVTMLRQIQKYEDKHRSQVPYMIVTDHSKAAIENPEAIHDGARSIFRNPQDAYLTGYSADLPKDRRIYFRALKQGHIISKTRKVEFDPGTRRLHIVCQGESRVSVDAPMVFALLGYKRDNKLFRAIETINTSTDGLYKPDIRLCDGAVGTHRDGYLSNVFALGAAARTGKESNAGVVPGILGQIPETVLTMVMRAYARQHPLHSHLVAINAISNLLAVRLAASRLPNCD